MFNKEKDLINKDTFKKIESSSTCSINPGNICYCIKTSKSKKPKPIEGNFYICRKIVKTKWGIKVIVVDIDSNETWGDINNLICVENKIANEVNKNLIEDLNSALHNKILEDCTPAIGEVLKKNYAGLEMSFTNGSKLFVSRKIIYPESIYDEASQGEIISINLPTWFAYQNKIINTIEEQK